MKVSEIIAKLQEFNADDEVCMWNDKDECHWPVCVVTQKRSGAVDLYDGPADPSGGVDR